MRLQANDVLLLVSNSDFVNVHKNAPQFALMSEVGVANVPTKQTIWRPLIVASVAIAMIVLSSIDEVGVSLFVMAIIASYIFYLMGVITIASARKAVDMLVMTMVASAIGLSSAMDNSGLANRMGHALTTLFGQSELGLLFGVYVGTTILNAFVSNSAAGKALCVFNRKY